MNEGNLTVAIQGDSMNWFVALGGLLYMGAFTYSLYKGHHAWSFVWFCYGASALVLAWIEGK